MKLLNKTNLYYLLFAVPVFIACSVFLYMYVSAEIRDSVDESLWKVKMKADKIVQEGKMPTDLDDLIELSPAAKHLSGRGESAYYFSDTLIYDSFEQEVLPYRVLHSWVVVDDASYAITIRKSTMESDDLAESIMYPVIILFVLLLTGFLIINRLVAKKLWKPFYTSLEKLNNFNLSSAEVSFDNSSVKEFSELNIALEKMTEKIRADYKSQKEFVENASHEIQTPLAVIRGKIEMLIQSSGLTEKDMEIIQSVYNASGKLSALNKALLLLSKIENDHFLETENVDFGKLVGKVWKQLEDLAVLKNISIIQAGPAPVKRMNAGLADILISNLMRNAIRHNIENGRIDIVQTENSIMFSNTSDYSVSNTRELFDRFRKSEASAESIGLGLAIVKEICEKYGIQIEYRCTDNTHHIILNF